MTVKKSMFIRFNDFLKRLESQGVEKDFIDFLKERAYANFILVNRKFIPRNIAEAILSSAKLLGSKNAESIFIANNNALSHNQLSKSSQDMPFLFRRNLLFILKNFSEPLAKILNTKFKGYGFSLSIGFSFS